ncbi:MAG: SelL-related redox protein [Planctomycetota bacterium]
MSMTQTRTTGSGSPGWARKWLIAAGIYNLVWGAVVVAFPGLLFSATGMEQPLYPQIWQCVGMIVGVYGIGYLAAARDSRRHWPIILVGFLGKIFGPMGFAMGMARGDLPPGFGLTIPTNDLIWWIPFGMMLWDAAKSRDAYPDGAAPTVDEALDGLTDQAGETLRALTNKRPTLVVLTRHSGCTFCKEQLADLASQQSAIRDAGLGIAVVTMSPPGAMDAIAGRLGLHDASWISDPERVAYRALEVGRGSFGQLFGLQSWVRGMAATLKGHRVGTLQGDGFQMPGAFVVHDGRVVKAYRHARASDRLDHAEFACGLDGGKVADAAA